MAGDPLEDAFRTELQTVITAASIPWPFKDTENTGTQVDSLTSFIDIEFHGGSETQYTTGAPGANFWQEDGHVIIGLFAARNTGHDLIGQYALAIRNAFRHRRFTMATGQTIRCREVNPMVNGRIDGGWWLRSLAINYRVFNQA